MASLPAPSGPKLDAKEDLLRPALIPEQWLEAEQRPFSALFKDSVFSVDVASRTTPALTAARFREVIAMIVFNCGIAIDLGFDPRDELDPEVPDNLAHAHVYNPKNGQKARARELARHHCRRMEF
ncbi:MAG: hypothetical protein J5I93_23565 [Pirellulaceae bacterium]|nr:hypothetical protein [Pirellulaceae bacterium]